MPAHVDDFLVDCSVRTDDGSTVTAQELTGVYLTWCENHSAEPLSQAKLSAALHVRGYTTVSEGHNRCYVGLAMRGPVVTEYILSTY